MHILKLRFEKQKFGHDNVLLEKWASLFGWLTVGCLLHCNSAFYKNPN